MSCGDGGRCEQQQQQQEKTLPSKEFFLPASLSDGDSAKRRKSSPLVLAEDLAVDSPDLLRAVPTNLLLRRLGQVFKDGEGQASTFEMSARVDRVDVFLSHSWGTSRWLKTVALLYRSNVNLAVVVPFALLVLVRIVRLLVREEELLFIPMEDAVVGGGGKVVRLHFSGNCLVYSLFFFVFLAFGSEIRSFGGKSTMFFLDKCCIHQTDPEKKMRGIRQLGGILANSRRMVILWQPEYLTRLWCVYELAAFSCLGRDPIVEIIPLKLPLLVLGLFCFHLIASGGLLILGPKLVFSEWCTDFIVETFPGASSIFVHWFACMMFGISLYIGAGTELP